jgi:hypothetical protein
VPVGFKWFVAGLVDGSLGFGGEESAGASFLRRDGTVWTTDKDGLIACLLAAELTAKTGRNPAVAYEALTARFGTPAYRRIDAPATREQKAILAKLSPAQIRASTLAGEPITAVLTRAPGNDAPIGGVKVVPPSMAGSRRAHPGPRTCTRSMPRASSARSISPGSSRRRRRSWPRLWPPPAESAETSRLSTGPEGPAGGPATVPADTDV